MISDTSLLILVLISIAFFPCVAIYSNWKIGFDHRRKKKKIAEFLEKAADDQIKGRDGPE